MVWILVPEAWCWFGSVVQIVVPHALVSNLLVHSRVIQCFTTRLIIAIIIIIAHVRMRRCHGLVSATS